MCNNLLCPECGCPEVVVYDDGTCECQGCGFVADIVRRKMMLRFIVRNLNIGFERMSLQN